MTTKVSRVADKRPAMMVSARGRCISPPSPKPSAKGMSPKTVVSVVIKMGRSLSFAAAMMASSEGFPRLFAD